MLQNSFLRVSGHCYKTLLCSRLQHRVLPVVGCPSHLGASHDTTPSCLLSTSHSPTPTESWPREIHSSDRIKDRDSIFLAHASSLPSSSMFPVFQNYLKSSPSLKRATHFMWAYNSTNHSSEGPQKECAQHDGGEPGSGKRLSRLLESSGCNNTVIVVSRWYGGTKLGSDRWRRISEVAKQALERGGFMENKLSGDARTGKKEKKRKK